MSYIPDPALVRRLTPLVIKAAIDGLRETEVRTIADVLKDDDEFRSLAGDQQETLAVYIRDELELAEFDYTLHGEQPAAWADPETRAAYDLTRPFTDADGDTWEHSGWFTAVGALPVPTLSLTGDTDPLNRNRTINDVIGHCGPLTQGSEPAGSETHA